MALETTTNRVSYAGNGVTTAFSFPYYFLAEADLVVIERDDTTGAETTKTLTTHYTVTGEGEEAGGTVTMLSAPATGKTLVIYRDPEITQSSDWRENDSMPAEQTEQAHDKAAMISQRLSERIDRAVRLPDGFSPTFDTTLPVDLDDSANKLPLVNEDGDGWADAADWPDVDGVTAGMEAAQAAAEAAQAAAEAAQAAAELAETNAETAETNAETAETNAETAESNAAASAAAAAASALAAANSAAATIWRDVVFLTSADSPFTVSNSHRGKLLACDTSGGAITLNLPSIAGLDLTSPYVVGVKKTTSDANAITINRNGTDTIDGNTSKTISVTNSGATLIPDTDPAPDRWTSADFGSSAGNLICDRFSGTGAQTAFTLSSDPGSENNIQVYIDGVYQQKNTFSVSGTTLTFSTAPPSGSDNIEVMIGTLLSIGTPSDGTVTDAKIATTVPTVQRLTAANGVYTRPSTAVRWIRVRLVGGGGGGAGGGSSGSNGGTGGQTSFGAALLIATGGAGGGFGGGTGAGGTVTVNSPAINVASLDGGSAHTGNGGGQANDFQHGLSGQPSPFGGAGGGSGVAAKANSGSGGSGGSGGANNVGGGGGAAGGYIEAIITAPSATYTYAVGSGGTGATGASQNGAAGGSGIIIVEEYYV